jgi:predicted metalloprotease with PDZ domain
MTRNVLLIFLLFSASLPGDDTYRVQFGGELQSVTVDACFDGPAPRQLYRHSKASLYTDTVSWGDRKIRNRSNSSRLTLPRLPENACIQWQVDLAKAVSQSDNRLALVTGNDLVTNGNLWFWRDEDRRPISVEVSLPTGYSISTPWQRASETPGLMIFRPARTPATWSSRIAIGRFQVQQIPTPGTHLRLATIGLLSHQQHEKITAWVRDTADSVASVFGNFPRDQAQILVIAIGQQREAVPWAHVIRGGGMGVEFFIDEQRSFNELNNDWTATHEFSHLLLPYISSNDRWLSEGLASYYQNVLRARDGRLSEEQAWQKLHSGFERGRAATKRESLASATRSGRSATMRIYWSGAAMMLEADARLRSLSEGRQSLDTALESFHDCCFDPGKRWTAREVFSRLDELTGYGVFSDLYGNHVAANRFPDISDTYDNLGLVTSSGSLTIDPDAPWSHIRYFIMNDPDSPVISVEENPGS